VVSSLKGALIIEIRSDDNGDREDHCYAYHIWIFLQPLKGDTRLGQKQSRNLNSVNILETSLCRI
jgi:hypothetical protein